MKFLLIHGSESAGFGRKTDILRAEFGQDSVINPSYPPDPKGAIGMFEYLCKHLRDDPEIFLFGTSLGGYYALYLAHKFKMKAIIINPLLKITKELFPIGKKVVNFKTNETYVLKEEWYNSLEELQLNDNELSSIADKIFLYLDEGDDLLDSIKTKTYFNSISPEFKINSYPGGSHPFDHMAELIADLKRSS